MSETGNEHFTQAMNKVKDTCGRNGEIAGNENLYNINAYQEGAQRKLDAARGMKAKILGEYPQAEAAANGINNTFVKGGENACKLIADALPSFRETGEFTVPEFVQEAQAMARSEVARKQAQEQAKIAQEQAMANKNSVNRSIAFLTGLRDTIVPNAEQHLKQGIQKTPTK